MYKTIVLSISIFFLFGFVAQSQGQNVSKAQSEVIKKQVNIVFQEMVEIAEELNFDELSSGVDDKHGAGFISNGRYYTYYNTLLMDVKANAQGLNRQDISIKEKKITVLSQKNALMTVSGVARATLIDGREISAKFHWSFVYELIDTKWKVIYSHQSRAN